MSDNYLYQKVYRILLDEIIDGKYVRGAILPSEKTLCDTFDVSLMTVRRALNELQEQNIIRKEKGRGSVVAASVRKSSGKHEKNIGVLDLENFGLHKTSYPPVPFDATLYNQNQWKNMLYNSMYSCLAKDYNIFVENCDVETFYDNFDSSIFQNIDKIFVVGIYTKKLIEFLQSKSKLVIVYNNFDTDISVCSVHSNERKNARIAVQKLISLGHTRLAAINGDISFSESVERYMGFQEAIMANGLPVNWSYIKWGNMTSQSGYHLTHQLLSLPEPPTTIVCVNDNVALGALTAVKEAGLRCPEDISIIGHDYNPDLHALTGVNIASIDPLYAQIGKKIAEKLSRNIWFDDECEVECELHLENTIGPCPNHR